MTKQSDKTSSDFAEGVFESSFTTFEAIVLASQNESVKTTPKNCDIALQEHSSKHEDQTACDKWRA